MEPLSKQQLSNIEVVKLNFSWGSNNMHTNVHFKMNTQVHVQLSSVVSTFIFHIIAAVAVRPEICCSI